MGSTLPEASPFRIDFACFPVMSFGSDVLLRRAARSVLCGYISHSPVLVATESPAIQVQLKRNLFPGGWEFKCANWRVLKTRKNLRIVSIVSGCYCHC